jgi:uncharacterized membrane protein YfcA
MSAATGAQPTAGQVLDALGQAASQVGAFVAHALDEQPAMALAAAATAGFIAGGGLTSPIGVRITSTTIRATFGNLATLIALDLLRRGLENGGPSRAGSESSGTA